MSKLWKSYNIFCISQTGQHCSDLIDFTEIVTKEYTMIYLLKVSVVDTPYYTTSLCKPSKKSSVFYLYSPWASNVSKTLKISFKTNASAAHFNFNIMSTSCVTTKTTFSNSLLSLRNSLGRVTQKNRWWRHCCFFQHGREGGRKVCVGIHQEVSWFDDNGGLCCAVSRF